MDVNYNLTVWLRHITERWYFLVYHIAFKLKKLDFLHFFTVLRSAKQNKKQSVVIVSLPSVHRCMWAGRGQLWTGFVWVSLQER